jgi:nitrite reductase/ring-hydroxylating ferredoxin subunit
MSWITEKLTSLLSDRNLTVDVLARQLAIERSRLTGIIAGSAVPNESLTKRLAKVFGEDPTEWLDKVQRPDDGGPAAAPPPVGFQKAAKVSEIAEGEMKIVSDGLAVIANAGGDYYAFGNVCPHAAGPIGDGFLEGCVVECPWHAGRWDVRTGKALTLLATADIPLFELRITGEDIEISLTPAALEQGVVSTDGPAN